VTTSEREWGELAAAWQLFDDQGTERLIRAAVTRQSRLMRILLGVEIVLTVGVLGWVGYLVAERPTPAMIGWGIAALVHSALIWGFAMWNRRGVWAPLGESTREYLALALERARREARAARFVIGLVSIEALAVAAYVLSVRPRATGWSWLVPAAVIGSALGWAIHRLIHSGRNIARLRSAGRELGLDVGPDSIAGGPR
jgi:hypothetical protein